MKSNKIAMKSMVPALCLALIAVGCQPPNIRSASLDEEPPRAATAPPPPIIAAPAGMKVNPGIYMAPLTMVATRPNPFALTATEEAYERQQKAAYLATNNGSFPLFNEPAPEIEYPPVVEPQPTRRLAGILIGSSVVALIDMGDGRIQDIYPGEVIPNTNWMVVSIDSEKAVLRRVNSNMLPHEVVVRLQAAASEPNNQQPGPSSGGAFPPPGSGGPNGIGAPPGFGPNRGNGGPPPGYGD